MNLFSNKLKGINNWRKNTYLTSQIRNVKYIEKKNKKSDDDNKNYIKKIIINLNNTLEVFIIYKLIIE